MMRNKIIHLICGFTLILTSCQMFAYQGSLVTEKEIKEMQNKNNFNAKEANAIIDYNLKKKNKRKRIENKIRKDQQEHLESLNSKVNKAKRIKQPVPVNFY